MRKIEADRVIRQMALMHPDADLAPHRDALTLVLDDVLTTGSFAAK